MSVLRTGKRNAALDTIKWLAVISMVLDHLRYLWPSADWLFVVGRLAFPLFCLAIAVNVVRLPRGSLICEANTRYLAWLLVFSAISELPYRWVSGSATSASIMPTLMLGLIVAWGAHYRTLEASLLAGLTLGLSLFLHAGLMYGVFGVLLPGTFVIALKAKRLFWLLPALVCVAANSRNRWVATENIELFGWLIIGTAFVAPLMGALIMSRPVPYRIWPVTRWGYWFYPVHLAAIGVARLLI